MSRRLDEELAQAIGETTAATPTAEGAPKPSPRRAPPKPRRSMGLLLTLLVMVGGLVGLFLVGFKEAAIYAMPVDQVLASTSKLAGRKIRVEGELVPGTLVKRDSPCEYRFTVHPIPSQHALAAKDPKNQLAVRYAQCVIPDTFRDMPGGGVQVTIEGSLSAEGHFQASQVFAKCSSKYDPKSHEMKGGASGGSAPPSMPVN
jgi:cytochrome c-type biogenesis protein CcmE